jgi:dephospho-CoA kinase
MDVIGLTGGIGSGKSTVAAMLRLQGATVINADDASRAVVEPGTDGFEAVKREFGAEYFGEGGLNRTKLADLVFSDPAARSRLEAITHPLVRQWVAQRTQEAAELGTQRLIYEVPLLYETGLETGTRAVIVVWVPEEVQLQRLIDLRGYDPARARARIDSQISIDRKKELADYVIDNRGSLAETEAQVKAVWSSLQASPEPGL